MEESILNTCYLFVFLCVHSNECQPKIINFCKTKYIEHISSWYDNNTYSHLLCKCGLLYNERESQAKPKRKKMKLQSKLCISQFSFLCWRKKTQNSMSKVKMSDLTNILIRKSLLIFLPPFMIRYRFGSRTDVLSGKNVRRLPMSLEHQVEHN